MRRITQNLFCVCSMCVVAKRSFFVLFSVCEIRIKNMSKKLSFINSVERFYEMRRSTFVTRRYVCATSRSSYDSLEAWAKTQVLFLYFLFSPSDKLEYYYFQLSLFVFVFTLLRLLNKCFIKCVECERYVCKRNCNKQKVL